MVDVLLATAPYFVLVLAGWLAARGRLLPEPAIPGLNAYALFFALPALLLREGLRTPPADLLEPVELALYLGCALIVVAFTVAVTLGDRVRMTDAAFGALVAAMPNTGFLGVPLLLALLGPAAAGPLTGLLLVDLFATRSLCVALSQAHGDTRQGAYLAAWRALRSALANPLPWAIAAGVAGSWLGVSLDGPADVLLRLLADSASPVALFATGAVLHRAGRQAYGRTRWKRVLPVALIKLLVHPALLLLLGLALRQAGVPLGETELRVMTLAAALPSASHVALLAERHGADIGRIARIVVASTVLAFGSFSTLAWWLGVRAAG